MIPPVVPATLPGELAEALIGSLFVAIGLATLAAGLAARPRRELIAIWFGVFSAMYGIRVAARSELFQLVTGWSPAVFAYADSFITYSILVPAGLFSLAMVGASVPRVMRRVFHLTVVYAAAGILTDVVRGRPGAGMWMNAPVVLTAVSVYVWHAMDRSRGSGRWSVAAQVVAAAALVFVAVAFQETVYRHAPFGIPFSLEPFAMLLLTLALGWYVLSTVAAQAAEFSALSRELRLARDIQQSLLPREMPVVRGLRLGGAYLPMSAVAGDFYDVVVRRDGEVVVIVADVSGHGVPAALVASMVKVAFAAEVERYGRPGEILAGINRTLSGKFEPAYVTAACAAFSRGAGLAYAAAGHPPAMLRRAQGDIVRLDRGGIALTMMPSVSYDSVDVPFGPGDRLLLFTDGLIEAARSGTIDDFFGDSELARVVAALDAGHDAGTEVLRAYRRWIGEGTPLADDVTLVVAERIGESEP